MKILLVEDEEDLALPLKKFFEINNFVVEIVSDGKKALTELSINKYSCVILDLNIPEIDGIKVSQTLRKKNNDVPIIMLTARSQIYNKLEGFEAGADDYVTKPFEFKELLMRVNAVIKRSSNNKSHELVINGYKFNTNKNTLTNGEEVVTLSNKESLILNYLLRNSGRVVSAEELLENVWHNDVDLFTSTIKTHIKTLRKKIDPQKKLIQTIRGKGYLIN